MSIRVYRYGLLPPTVQRERVLDQMRRAHKYRNDLVALERQRRAELRALYAQHTDTTVETTAREAAQQVEQALAALKHAQADGGKGAAVAGLKAALAAAKKVAKEANAAVRAARAKLREDPTVVATTKEINDRAAERHKAARAASGLYWGNYQLVDDDMQRVRQMPLYDGAAPNDPAFARFTHDGVVGVQIGLPSGGTPYLCANVFEEDTLVFIDPVSDAAWHAPRRGDRDRAQRTVLHMRVGSGEKRKPIMAEWPLRLHRPLPPHGVIKRAAVHVSRVADRERWWVCLTVQDDAPRTGCGKGAVAVDIGWRKVEEGLRVARWRGADGEQGEVMLSAKMVGALHKPEELRSVRDKAFNAARALLVTWLAAPPVEVPTWLTERTATLAQWRSPGRLAALVLAWGTARFPGDEGIFGRAATKEEILAAKTDPDPTKGRGEGLEGWRVDDLHLWRWEAFQRRGALGWRKDLYRTAAAHLAKRYGTLVLEDFDLRNVAERPSAESTEKVNYTARSNRQLAAVSELRQALMQAFLARGGDVVKVEAADTTRTCRHCGLVAKFNAAEDVTHVCEGCRTVFDQDDNASSVMLVYYETGRIAA